MPELSRTPSPSQARPATVTPIQIAPPIRHANQSVPASKPSVGLGGEPLQPTVQSKLEQSFATDLSKVRVHRDPTSQQSAQHLGARAFTFGPNIVLGPRERPDDLPLMAHETAHVIQQGATPQVQAFTNDSSTPLEREAQSAAQAVSSGSSFTVQGSTAPRVQRLGISDALDYFANKANIIPGFRMFTIILGVNPINMGSVDRSAANILRAIIEFVPGGALITQALENHGVFAKVGTWVESQIKTLGMVGSAFKKAITDFLDSLGWSDIFHLGDVWNRAKRIFTEPIDRLISFGKGLVTDIIKFIKDAILIPLVKLAEGTRGWDLLIAILGKNPITGDTVPRNAETLIGGFMKLIGQDEIWQNMKKANAIGRAWAWFQGAMTALMAFVSQIPTLAIAAFKSLEITDIILVPRAFAKVGAVFGNFIGEFISWAGRAVWNLLEIIFEVVAPAVIPYIKKAAGAFRTILKNPVGFVSNLVRAGKLGFQMFANNILEHLKAALIKWLTGPLGDAGVYIPKSFNLMEIIKLVLSVLGLTWQNVRSKLVKIIPEPVLVALEKTASILVTLVKDGPVAAWEQIKTELSELKDQLISQVTEMVTTEIVKAAITKLVSMLNPAGAIIQAIIAIYNTVTFFIQKINQIAAVVASFIDSISAIAAGQVDNAAKKVEQTMASTLVVIIGFLAKFAGLGNIPEKLVGVIKKIRQPIDKGLDKIVGWLGKMLEKAKNVLSGKKDGKPDERTLAQKESDLRNAVAEAKKLDGKLKRRILNTKLNEIKGKYRLSDLTATPVNEKLNVHAAVNPEMVFELHDEEIDDQNLSIAINTARQKVSGLGPSGTAKSAQEIITQEIKKKISNVTIEFSTDQSGEKLVKVNGKSVGWIMFKKDLYKIITQKGSQKHVTHRASGKSGVFSADETIVPKTVWRNINLTEKDILERAKKLKTENGEDYYSKDLPSRPDTRSNKSKIIKPTDDPRTHVLNKTVPSIFSSVTVITSGEITNRETQENFNKSGKIEIDLLEIEPSKIIDLTTKKQADKYGLLDPKITDRGFKDVIATGEILIKGGIPGKAIRNFTKK